MSVSELQKSLIEAISAISTEAADEKESAITIKGEIVEELDAGSRNYSLKFQDTIYKDAFAINGAEYVPTTIVYALVPSGNFDNPKIILSAIQPSAKEYAETIETEKYISLNDDLLSLGAASEQKLQTWVSSTSKNLLTNSLFGGYFSKYLEDGQRNFIFSAVIKTNIDVNHQTKGNYGLKLTLPFKTVEEDETKSKEITREYLMDVTTIEGNPYNLSEYQKIDLHYIIDDSLMYDSSRLPELFCFVKDFEYSQKEISEKKDTDYDIHIRDISFMPEKELTETEQSGYYLKLTSNCGNYFLSSESEQSNKIITPILKVNGKTTNLENWKIYWFVEDSSITMQSDGYIQFGGVGWKCINQKIKTENDDNGKESYEYVTNQQNLIIKPTDVKAVIRYKCIIVSGSTVVTDIIKISKLGGANLKLFTPSGSNNFTANLGYVTLIAQLECNKTQTNIGSLYTEWQRFDKDGNYLDNDFYDLVRNNEKVKEKDDIVWYETEIKYDCSKMDQMNTIHCTYYERVQENGLLVTYSLGTQSIAVTASAEATYILKINNGDVLYKYDSDGNSPLISAYDNTIPQDITINPISFQLFKPTGEELNDEEYERCIYKWRFPINSMMKLKDTTGLEKDSDYYFITNSREIEYTILEAFNIKKNNNTILLEVNFNGEKFTSNISPNFLKEGMNGTNGSKYSAVLRYIDPRGEDYAYGERDSNGLMKKMQFIYKTAEGEEPGAWYLYDCYMEEGEKKDKLISFDKHKPYLKVDLYKDGQKVTNYNQSDNPLSIQLETEWEMFDSFSMDTNLSFNVHSDYGLVNGVPTGDPLKGYLSLVDNSTWEEVDLNLLNTVQVKITIKDGDADVSQETVFCYYPIEVTRVKRELLNTMIIDGEPITKAEAKRNAEMEILNAKYEADKKEIEEKHKNDPDDRAKERDLKELNAKYEADEKEITKAYETVYKDNSRESILIPNLEGGFIEVVYASDGTNPQYDNTNAFECINSIYNNTYDLDEENLYDYVWLGSENLKIPKDSIEPSCAIKPITMLNNGVTNNYIRVELRTSSDKRAALMEKREELIKTKQQYQELADNAEKNITNITNLLKYFNYDSYKNNLKNAEVFLTYRYNMLITIDSLKDVMERLNNYYKKNTFINNYIKVSTLYTKYTKGEKNFDNIYNSVYIIEEEADKYLSNIIALTDEDKIKMTDENISKFKQSNLNKYKKVQSLIDEWNKLINDYNTAYKEVTSRANGDNTPYIYNPQVIEILNVSTGINSLINSTELTNLIRTESDDKEFSTLKANLECYYRYIFDKKGELISLDKYDNNLLLLINKLLEIYSGRNLQYQKQKYDTLNDKYTQLVREYQDKINEINRSLLNDQGIIHIRPIIMLTNRYEFSNINAWDGNKLYIDTEHDQYLLAPQIGAGQKTDGLFTGMIMGVKKFTKDNLNKTQIGLFGYSNGEQSLFLNSKDGSAIFGKSGDGQITIDPRNNKALIYSYNYWPPKVYGPDGKPTSYNNVSGKGMLINLTDAYIRFGKEADGKIYSGAHNIINSTADGFFLNQKGLSIGSKIRINADGVVKVGDRAVIDGATNCWTIDGNNNISYISFKTTEFKSDPENGNINGNDGDVYIGTNGIRLGKKFAVDNNGNLVTKKIIANDGGTIGGWTIDKNLLRNGDNTLRLNAITGEISGGTSEKAEWHIKSNGYAKFNHVEITSETSDGNTKIGDLFVNKDGGIRSFNFSAGVSGFNLGKDGILKAMGVDLGGKITATSGSIGGIQIGASGGISGTTWSLTNTGGKIGGWTINEYGIYSEGSDVKITPENIIIPKLTVPSIGSIYIDYHGTTLESYLSSHYQPL